MSCAACSSRVEKAVSKVDGVTSCSVSLLTNSMGVDGSASDRAVIEAVEAAGYGAAVKGHGNDQKGAAAGSLESMESAKDALIDRETPKLRKRLIASVIFLIVLMYFSMGHRCGTCLFHHFLLETCSDGAFAAASYNCGNDNKSEIFRKRI